MKHFLYCVLGILLIVVASCSKFKDQAEILQREFSAKGLSVDPSIENLFIIPGGGCGGCVAAGIDFLTENSVKFSIHQTKNKVIFTNVGSIKLLQRSLEDMDIDSLNSTVDKDNLYLTKEYYSIYPILLEMDSGIIKNVHIQSPKTEPLTYFSYLLK
ncbi:MAG: hypothetical protein LUD17_00705 [Bacteroidales bacterium]|nr:hypothetical protein [Bacteroidales bacterium]